MKEFLPLRSASRTRAWATRMLYSSIDRGNLTQTVIQYEGIEWHQSMGRFKDTNGN